ncbi:MAG: hypothetical protein U1F77_06845 [Kiritimatiellia bacterium]
MLMVPLSAALNTSFHPVVLTACPETFCTSIRSAAAVPTSVIRTVGSGAVVPLFQSESSKVVPNQMASSVAAVGIL